MNLTALTHPEYRSLEWTKWRLAYQSGDEFIERYLEKFSARETDADFTTRKAVTYCPAFAKAAINDVKNSIFQRIPVVTREGGPKTWLDACDGKLRGVDLRGSTMNSFVGRQILPELLVLGKVGVFVDREKLPDQPSLADVKMHPYYYVYRAEDIMSWTYQNNSWEYKTVLLRDRSYVSDEVTGLPTSTVEESYRFCYIGADGFVHVDFYNNKNEATSTSTLRIKKIPFIVMELTDSLMADAANYQIALLNMGSSDVAFCLKGNFPFYTEQTDPRSTGGHLKKSTDQNSDGTVDDEIQAGVMHGRTYPKGSERPGFIAPSTDPLRASMLKQQELKDDIRLLVNLSLSNIKPKMASAESKGMDERGLEAGLSYIGMELEHGERRLAQIWAMYEGDQSQPTVKYPERYSLKSDADLLEEAKSLEERMMAIPSDTYKREVAKKIATVMLGSNVSLETLDKMHAEIDKATLLTTDPDVIQMMVENALLDNEAAAVALGAPPGSPAKAAKDHAERVARTLSMQSAMSATNMSARGADNSTQGAKEEKKVSQDPSLKDDGKAVRGDANTTTS